MEIIFIYVSDVDNLVVDSVWKIVVSFSIGLTDDFEVNLNVLVSVAGGAILHLVVVRIINQKSVDTTVLIPFVKSRILCRKELFCSVVADFLILDSLEVIRIGRNYFEYCPWICIEYLWSMLILHRWIVDFEAKVIS